MIKILFLVVFAVNIFANCQKSDSEIFKIKNYALPDRDGFIFDMSSFFEKELEKLKREHEIEDIYSFFSFLICQEFEKKSINKREFEELKRDLKRAYKLKNLEFNDNFSDSDNIIEEVFLTTLDTMFFNLNDSKNSYSLLVELNGDILQKLLLDKKKSINLYRGDKIRYFLYSKKSSDNIFLILKSKNLKKQFKLKLDSNLNSIDIDFKGAKALDLFIFNPKEFKNISIKFIITSINKTENREEFIKLLKSQKSIAREFYKKITGDSVRLKAKASLDSKILKLLKLGTIVKVIENRKNWIKVQLPNLTIGWVSRDYLKRF